MGAAYDALADLVPRLNASRRARNLMEAFPRTIGFELDGELGPFAVAFRAGEATLEPGVAADADIVVSGSSQAFAEVLCDNVDLSHPIARGQLLVSRGKVSEMTMLNRVLWSARRG